MRSTTYVAAITLDGLCPFLRVALAHEALAVRLMGVVLLVVCVLLLASVTISPTLRMTSPCILYIFLAVCIILNVDQRFTLSNGIIYGLDLLQIQLHPGQILQPLNDVEQHVLICEVGNLKYKSSEILHICLNVSRLLQFPKHTPNLLHDVIREEGFLESHRELFLHVDGTRPLHVIDFFSPLP